MCKEVEYTTCRGKSLHGQEGRQDPCTSAYGGHLRVPHDAQLGRCTSIRVIDTRRLSIATPVVDTAQGHRDVFGSDVRFHDTALIISRYTRDNRYSVRQVKLRVPDYTSMSAVGRDHAHPRGGSQCSCTHLPNLSWVHAGVNQAVFAPPVRPSDPHWVTERTYVGISTQGTHSLATPPQPMVQYG